VVALESEKKAAERQKDLIARRESLRDAEIELEKKNSELADVRRQALELELQLAVRRLDQERAGRRAVPGDARTRQVLGDLEKRTLQLQQQEVEKSKEVADRRKEIIKKRLEILDAQRKFLVGT
jgi:predicted  nucleic acid-binding Zn-ribbon protein